MSTPLVAGRAALFRQYLVERAGIAHPSAALLKAAMINGARSLSPGQYGTGATQEIPPRPSNVEGWGQVNVDGTLFPDAPACRAYLDGRPPLVTGARADCRVYVRDTQPVRVTLAWSDYPSTPAASVNLVNDLDLTVIQDATTNFPNKGAQADRRNNVEGVDFTPTAPGFVTVRVEGWNVPSGPQPYALVLGGDIELAPVIRHTPLENQFETTGAYAVDALIACDTPVDTNNLCLYWNTTGSHDTFLTGALALVSNSLYRGWIPAQPLGTRVYYYLAAATNSFAVTAPADAPASLFSFAVTPPFALTVSGAPAEYGAVAPPYGAGQMASGALVQASGYH